MPNTMLFTMVGMYISVLFFWVSIVYFGLASVVIYIVTRWRNAKSSRQDSQIGSKVALHFLLSLSIFVAVLGGSIIVVDQLLRVVTDSSLGLPNPAGVPEFDPINARLGTKAKVEVLSAATRTGFGMVVAGVILGLSELWLVFSRTNDRRWPAVRRSFVGSRTVVHGLVVTAAVTLAFVVGLQEGSQSTDEVRKRVLTTCLGILAVWGGSLLVHLGLLFRYSRQADVPGESYRCDECGEDLRGQLRAGDLHCTRCRSALSLNVRRTVSSLEAGGVEIEIVRTVGKEAGGKEAADAEEKDQQGN